jgi:integrase
MKPSARGNGRIFRKKDSRFWWCAYYVTGKEIRESTGVVRLDPDPSGKSEKEALRYLKRKTDEVGAARQGLHTFISPAQRRTTVNELLDALEADCRARGKYDKRVASNLKPLREQFGKRRAMQLSGMDIDNYILKAQESGSLRSKRKKNGKPGEEAEFELTFKPARNATINRRLQLLAQAYKLAITDKKLSADSVPRIRHLSEKDNVRQGFFSDAEVRAVMANLPEYLQDFVLFGYLCGWRKGEIASLGSEDVDGDIIRLRPEHSKNGEGRMVTTLEEPELVELLERRKAARTVETPTGPMLAEYLFHHNGQPIGDFRKAWATACKMAGVQGKLFHDLRRTAVREMIRSGVHEATARRISGHKTPSMLQRYNIQTESDIREAMQLRAARIAQQREENRVVTMPATKAVQ